MELRSAAHILHTMKQVENGIVEDLPLNVLEQFMVSMAQNALENGNPLMDTSAVHYWIKQAIVMYVGNGKVMALPEIVRNWNTITNEPIARIIVDMYMIMELMYID